MWTKYLVEKDFNPKRVLMTGPVKLNESPYKVSNKRDFLTPEQLKNLDNQQAERLTHAHNLLIKKTVNNLYFEVNKNESKERMFNISPDDFVFEDRATVKKAEQREKFLKKYLKMKKKKQEEKERLK